MDRRGDRGRPHLIVRAPVAAVLAIATWPYGGLRPRLGIDGSWMAGLHLAASRGLDHGSEVLFTHGPLGFLAQPRSPVAWTAVLSVLFVLALRFALCLTALSLLRRRVPFLVAVVLTGVLSWAIRSEAAELLVALSLVWALLAVRGVVRYRPGFAGALAAAATLVKFNAGVAVLFFAVVAGIAAGHRLVRLPVAYAGTFLGAWLVTGNSLGDVPRWLRGSYELAAGYTTAMAGELPGLRHHYAVAPLLVLALVALGVTVPERRARWACGLLLLGGSFLAVKHGFVRHDAHAAAFFLPCALAPLALLRRGRADVLALAVAATGAAYVASLLGPPGPEVTRSEARAVLRIDDEVIAAVGSRTVHVDPWEVSAVWAYGLRWRPVPVFQSYSAYTPWLDDLNASGLAADVVLRPVRPAAVDGRVPAFESPAYALALACSYRPEVVGARWQLLARGPWRCGPESPLGSVAAAPGTDVAVPAPSAPDRVVYARLRLSVPATTRLRDLLLKSPADRIELDGRSYRFVRGTAGQPHVLRLPDGSVSFAALRLPRWAARVDFYEVPLVSVTPPS